MFSKHFSSGFRENKKEMSKIFKENGLNIPVECNLVITDILDVLFDLKSATYYPYRKQTKEILHIHKQSTRTPSILKQIPSTISKRVSDKSCESHHFNNTALKKVVSVEI